MQPDEARWWTLEPRPGETLRRALERTLRDAILSGALREGVALPSSRALAAQLGISRGVVSDSYAQLSAQGFLVTQRQAAPVVAGMRSKPADSDRASDPPVHRFRYDLTPTSPDVTLFPLGRWLSAHQRAARRASVATLGYRNPLGERELREALAEHLGMTRGVIAEPEQIAVVQGTGQAFDLLLRVLRVRGVTTFAVEDPSHALQQARVAAHGFRLRGQPVDRGGMVVDGLEADAVLVTPAHQFPTGCVLTGDRRRQLLEWAETNETLIAEDDYDAEFRYDRDPVRALQGLAPDRVVQLGTVSKTLAPSLRLGWLVAPVALIEELRRQKELADDFSPALNQLALAEFLRCGDYHRHVRRARKVYRARRDLLLEALSRHLPELKVEGIAAGVHVVVRLPDDADDAEIARAAYRVGIRVAAMSTFAAEHPVKPALVVGYGRLHESAAVPAARELAKVIRERRSAKAPPLGDNGQSPVPGEDWWTGFDRS